MPDSPTLAVVILSSASQPMGKIKKRQITLNPEPFSTLNGRNFSISWGSSLKMLHLRSMGMSFFVSCPITDALADPHKSGHQ
ncbi:MAG: hypothetical protein J7K02_10760, partial [Deltaproteobacteria bacterium]|nr:hypothetical protein [Deltaproteobacteria bacterium]